MDEMSEKNRVKKMVFFYRQNLVLLRILAVLNLFGAGV